MDFDKNFENQYFLGVQLNENWHTYRMNKAAISNNTQDIQIRRYFQGQTHG